MILQKYSFEYNFRTVLFFKKGKHEISIDTNKLFYYDKDAFYALYNTVNTLLVKENGIMG